MCGSVFVRFLWLSNTSLPPSLGCWDTTLEEIETHAVLFPRQHPEETLSYQGQIVIMVHTISVMPASSSPDALSPRLTEPLAMLTVTEMPLDPFLSPDRSFVEVSGYLTVTQGLICWWVCDYGLALPPIVNCTFPFVRQPKVVESS